MPYSFRFRLIPFLIMLIICSAGISLSVWQTRRAVEKETMAQSLQQRSKLPALQTAQELRTEQEYRRVSLRGKFVKGWPLYLDNRPLNGVAGMQVLMPFQLSDTNQYVMVMRGWQARNPVNRSDVGRLVTPEQTVLLEGVIRLHADRVMQLGQPEALKPGAILQNLKISELIHNTGYQMPDLYIEQTSDSQDGLQRNWTSPSSGSDKNRGYAFQWLALTLMAFIFFVVIGFRRGTN